MGINKCFVLLDGKIIIFLKLYGVILMFIGFMFEEDKVVVWCGLMLMGVL